MESCSSQGASSLPSSTRNCSWETLQSLMCHLLWCHVVTVLKAVFMVADNYCTWAQASLPRHTVCQKKMNLYLCFDSLVIIVSVLFWHVSKIQSKNSFLRGGAIKEMECYSLCFQPPQKTWGKPPLLRLMPTFSHEVNFHQTFSIKQFIAYLCYKSLSISKACLHSSVT